MKVVRYATLALSLIWIAVFCVVVFVAPEGQWAREDLPMLLLVLPLAIAGLCFAQAGPLKLSPGAWAFAGLVLPFLTPFILALKRPPADVNAMKEAGDIDGLIGVLGLERGGVGSDAYVALIKDLPAQQTVPRLIPALRAGKKRVRPQVIRVLAAIQTDAAVQALLEVLKDCGYPERAAVAHALDSCKKPGVCDALITVLGEGKDIKMSAIHSLGELRCSEAGTALIELFKKDSGYRRFGEARALGRIGCRDAVEPLLEALNAGKPEIQSGIIEALGRIGDKRALTPLIAKLEKERRRSGGKDPRWFIRHEIVEALGRFKYPEAFKPLQACLNDPHGMVRDAAAEAFTGLKKSLEGQGIEVPDLKMNKCASCGKWIQETPMGVLAVLTGTSPNLSGTQSYPCKSCGCVFCIDCMAGVPKIADKRSCPKCFGDSGW